MGASSCVEFPLGPKGYKQRQIYNLMVFLRKFHHHVKDRVFPGGQWSPSLPPLSSAVLADLPLGWEGSRELTMYEPSLGPKDSHKDKEQNGSLGVSHPPIIRQGFQESSDCCVSYASQIPCSRFISYFSTSGGCSMPGIIFITKKGRQVCANPSDLRVQNCLSTLSQVPRSGNKLIAWEGGHALPSAFFCLPW